MINDQEKPAVYLEFSDEERAASTARMKQRNCEHVVNAMQIHYYGARVNKSKTIEQIAEMSGLTREQIIDFELANLPLPEVVEVARTLKPIYEINDNLYNKLLMSTSKAFKK